MMNRNTKIILSVLGIGAVVVPAIFLILFTKNSQVETNLPSENRTIDQKSIESAVDKIQPKEPQFPSPSPATPSAEKNQSQKPESTKSAQ